MKYKKGKKITDKCQFKKGKKYLCGNDELFEFSHIGKCGNDELFEFSHIGECGNPYFKDEGQSPYLKTKSEYNCIGFSFRISFYEAIEVAKTLDDKIIELIELGKSKGLKINVTFE
jgi:hypothetical protein